MGRQAPVKDKMMGSRLMAAAVLLACLAVACARLPRNEAERLQDEERLRRQEESGIHTYYVLVKKPAAGPDEMDRMETLAADFHKRLGGDTHVSVVAASKQKLVIKIKGDDAFAKEIVAAAQSFPETAMLEKKPILPHARLPTQARSLPRRRTA